MTSDKKQLVRYYGYYSNVSRGKRKKVEEQSQEVIEVDPPPVSKELKKRWSYFIRKIYETDPLACPKCQGEMRIISFIDRPDVIKKILQHLGLWEESHAPPGRDPPACSETCRTYERDYLRSVLRFDKLTVPRKIEGQPGYLKVSLPQPGANVQPYPGTRAEVDIRADYRVLSLPNWG